MFSKSVFLKRTWFASILSVTSEMFKALKNQITYSFESSIISLIVNHIVLWITLIIMISYDEIQTEG